jgi:hypothetical protein
MTEKDSLGKGYELITGDGPRYPSSMLPEVVVGGVRFALTRLMSLERAKRIVHGAEVELDPETERQIETTAMILEHRDLVQQPFQD